jgi:hypothetical protein
MEATNNNDDYDNGGDDGDDGRPDCSMIHTSDCHGI